MSWKQDLEGTNAVENPLATEAEELLTVPEAAARYRLHPTTVGKLCRTGQIGAFRVGNGRGRWRIPKARMKAYDDARTPAAA